MLSGAPAYPISYGVQCTAHAEPPFCSGPSPPPWCADVWCYVRARGWNSTASELDSSGSTSLDAASLSNGGSYPLVV